MTAQNDKNVARKEENDRMSNPAFCLPSSSENHLVLDLDHTLISSFEFGESPIPKPEGVCTVSPILVGDYVDELGLPQMYHATISNVVVLIKLRPFVRTFIRSAASSGMTIHVYTKGRRSYMQEVIRLLDSECLIKGRRVSRDDEPPHLKDSQKDISLIRGGFPPRFFSAIVLDDSPNVWASCLHTGGVEVIEAKRYAFSDMFVEFLRRSESGGAIATTPRYPRDCDNYLKDLFHVRIQKFLDIMARKRSPSLLTAAVVGENESQPIHEEEETYTPISVWSEKQEDEEEKSIKSTHTTSTSISKVRAFINVNRRSIF